MVRRTTVIISIIIIATLVSSLGLPFGVPSTGAAGEGVKLPPPPPREIVNVNLDSALNQLIIAQRQGQAESFARQSNIELINESVWVIIEGAPGQVEAVTLAATEVGAERLRAGSIGDMKNWLKALVPITSLEALANENNIERIDVADAGQPAKSN